MKKISKIDPIDIFGYCFIILMLCGFFGYCYYKAHYCKEIPYIGTCKECTKWVEKDNGMQGKYRRTWEECEGYEYYKCQLHYDSCGCTKLK